MKNSRLAIVSRSSVAVFTVMKLTELGAFRGSWLKDATYFFTSGHTLMAHSATFASSSGIEMQRIKCTLCSFVEIFSSCRGAMEELPERSQ